MASLGSCKLNSFEETVVPNTPPVSKIEFPLLYQSKVNVTGKIVLEKLNDGTIRTNIQLEGLDKSQRYFGKISSSNSADFGSKNDIADLGEINTATGGKLSWIRLDYNNNAILYDSLIEADAMVRILELNPLSGAISEVLRGDIGSNLLVEGVKTFYLLSVDGSNTSGVISLRQRKNGKVVAFTTVNGLSVQSNVAINLFKGDYESGSFSKLQSLNNYSGGQKQVNSNVGFFDGNFNGLDTMKGFIGVESELSRLDSIKLIAVANLGGNLSSGNTKVIPIYSQSDSSLIAKLIFEEIGITGGDLKMTFKPIQISSNKNFFLSFHKGTTIDPDDSIRSYPIASNKDFALLNPKLINGGTLKYSDINSLNANIRITETGFSNLIGSADIGINEILNEDSIQVLIDQTSSSYPGFTAFAKFKSRRSGEIFCSFILNNSYAGEDHSISIVRGDLPDPDVSEPKVDSINFTTGNFLVAGQPGGQNTFKGKVNMKTKNLGPALWLDLKNTFSTNGFLEYSFSGGVFSRKKL